MSLAALAITLSALGILVTGYLAAIFVANPAAAMRKVHHLPEFLPQVMADRYVANLVLAVAATLYGDLSVIAVLFAVFAFMAFADAAIYARASKPYMPHFIAGIGAGIVAAVALAARFAGAAG
ncbi:hypothetical protein [Sinisalibacter aestuarii]|uniref:MAPEG family protein n=1 Tax=Sinisalibacter aestuarii TaxID=2949426 RepID=A0ABQ5LT51_9RHOB|nr:hypothetical protein [Sinisalibacter aestuarii]GKY87798.1 hypothetical protein STA1M1_16670 [Sinisalibacter aestuarii]